MSITKNNYFRAFLECALYLVAFAIIQVACVMIAKYAASQFGFDLSLSIVVASAVSGIITIVLFAYFGWSPFSRVYIQTRPWFVLSWVALLALGTIVPSQWLTELMKLDMPEDTLKLLYSMMDTPWGYMAVGVLVPVAEEMTFRGAVLRKLLELFGDKGKWFAIVISAVVFGVFHGNMPQMVHATLVGLLLGWMYARTNSIVPGVVFHWVNNTVAYVAYRLLPQAQDGNLADIFGSERGVYMALGFSLCIFLPSLFQLAVRLRK